MAIQVQPDDRRRRRSSARNYLQTECVRWRRPSGRRVPRATVRRAKPSGRRRKFDFFLYCTFQRIILTSKGHTGANADKHFHLISSSSRIDKRLRLSRSTLRPQLTAERSSHWDTTQQYWEVVVIMPTFGFPLKVIKMIVMRTISSLLRSTLLPQFTTIRNAVTAILRV